LAFASVFAAAALASTASASSDALPTHVTVIGDSVLTAVIWNEEPLDIVSQGLDVDMEVGVCRRLVDLSCPFEGSRAPTLLDLVAAFGPRLGKVVAVVAGYNEPEAGFANAVEESLAALRGVGVTRVLWASLSESRDDYKRMNTTLAAEASRHPELKIVDWAGASRGHTDWFLNDGVHLEYAGAVAMARLLRGALDKALVAPEAGALADSKFGIASPAASLPKGRVGRWYDTSLLATGGAEPYRWIVTSGALPKGLHLTPAGRLYGVPTRALDMRVAFRVQDADGLLAARSATLVVSR